MQQEKLYTQHDKTLQSTTVKISGMTCTSCAQSIEKALTRATGVGNASVNFATETAYIEYDDQATSKQALITVIQGTGYDVVRGTQRLILRIGGMTCASCAQTIEHALRKTDGIEEANVNLATEKAMVVYDSNREL